MRAPGTSRHLYRLLAPLALLSLALPASVSAATLSNPPQHAGSGFTLKVHGLKGTLSLYLSPRRKLAHGDVPLGHVKVKHGKVTVKITSNVRPGAYFVLLCTGHGHHQKCTASKTATAIVPSHIPTTAGVVGAPIPASGSAASGVASAGGGVLRATGPEGTKYALAYAANSVQPGTTLTLVPLSGLTGPGLGKFVGGAEVEPAGLTFLHGADLVITPAHAPVATGRHGVRFALGSGQLRAVPVAPQAAPLVLSVASSGGYALLSGGSPAAQIAGAGPRVSAHAASATAHVAAASAGYAGFYEPLLAGLVEDLPPGTDIGGSSSEAKSFESTVVSLLNEWYADITGNLVPAGMESDEGAELAITELATWGRTGALLIGDGHTNVGGETVSTDKYSGMSAVYGAGWEEQKIFSVIQKLAGSAYDRAQTKCANEHDYTQFEKILSWYRTDLLSGHPDTVPFSELLACDVFKLSFESKMDDKILGHENEAVGNFVNDYTASVLIKPQTENTSTFPLSGSATGSYSEASGEVDLDGECKNAPVVNERIEQSGPARPLRCARSPTRVALPPRAEHRRSRSTSASRPRTSSTRRTAKNATRSRW